MGLQNYLMEGVDDDGCLVTATVWAESEEGVYAILGDQQMRGYTFMVIATSNTQIVTKNSIIAYTGKNPRLEGVGEYQEELDAEE